MSSPQTAHENLELFLEYIPLVRRSPYSTIFVDPQVPSDYVMQMSLFIPHTTNLRPGPLSPICSRSAQPRRSLTLFPLQLSSSLSRPDISNQVLSFPAPIPASMPSRCIF